MMRLMASLALAASLLLVGCEKKDDSKKDMNTAAEKTGAQAADALDKAKSNVSTGVDQAKDAAKQGAANTASNMDTVQKNIDDLISKAKDSVKDKKWSDAEGYIDQIKKLEVNLPQAAQDPINANLADVQKMIDAGKMMTPGK